MNGGLEARDGTNGGDGGKTEKDPQKIAEGIAEETLDKIRPKMTEEEATQMKSDGGVDQEELKTMFAKAGLKPSASSDAKFTELDTNKNGKLEESEVKSDTKGEGEDYLVEIIEGLLEDVAKKVLVDTGVKIIKNLLGNKGKGRGQNRKIHKKYFGNCCTFFLF